MFDKERYITSGVKTNIPPYLQNLIWYLIETMKVDKTDYLQVFEMSESLSDDKRKQKIVHTQEQPEYSEEYVITTKEVILEKIYVINDGAYSTMLLASEY